MKRLLIDRRAFLRAAGGLAIALPTLEAMFTEKALAAGTADPKRYVCMYVASGTYLKTNNGAFWYPGSTSQKLSAAALPDVFSPFAANAGDFSVIRGLNNAARFQCQGTGGDHSTAIASYLTSTPYTDGTKSTCTMAGSSFDQAIAHKNGLTAVAMSAGGYDGFHADSTPFDYSRTVSYLNGTQADCWLNPYALFQSLFGKIPRSDGGTAPVSLFSKNKSVLDSATKSITKLKGMVGKADQQRIDDYYTHLRTFESGLAPVTQAAVCNPGAGPATSLNNEDHNGTGTDFNQRLKAFMDIMVLAFQCNNAQMFSLMFEYENTNRQFKNQIQNAASVQGASFGNLVYQGADMNTPGSHNEIAHWSDAGDAEVTERRNRCVSRDRFYASWVVYLINQLKGLKDPSGSAILDNTVIQMGHGLEDGNHNTDGAHPGTGHPVMLAGGKNFLTPGSFYALPNNDLADLYYTLNQKMGMGLPNFGGSTKTIPI